MSSSRSHGHQSSSSKRTRSSRDGRQRHLALSDEEVEVSEVIKDLGDCTNLLGKFINRPKCSVDEDSLGTLTGCYLLLIGDATKAKLRNEVESGYLTKATANSFLTLVREIVNKSGSTSAKTWGDLSYALKLETNKLLGVLTTASGRPGQLALTQSFAPPVANNFLPYEFPPLTPLPLPSMSPQYAQGYDNTFDHAFYYDDDEPEQVFGYDGIAIKQEHNHSRRR